MAWPHPEWWTVALSVIAWLGLVGRTHSIAASPGSPEGHGHAPAFDAGVPVYISDTFDWLLMVVAMMLPLVLHPIRATAARSLWRRRHRAIGGFLVGYMSPWLVLGLSGVVGAGALGLTAGRSPSIAAIGFAIAAAWQVTPIKRWALRSCHRTSPLAPDGWRADLDCARYGWMIGTRCLVSCWALMLACSLAGHGAVAMASASSIGLAERYAARPDQRVMSGVLCGLAVIYMIAALS